MAGRRRVACSSFVLVPFLVLGSAAQAQFSRVFVAAKTGNDASSCNDVATPCKTFAGAMTQVIAGGEVITLESGGYGPFTINKSVSVNAPTGIVAFIHPPSGDAITINAGGGDTVVLRGLTLNGGTGNGIAVNTVGQLFVEECTITGYSGNGINFHAPGATLVMRDDDGRNCYSGVDVGSGGAAARAVIRRSTFGGSVQGFQASSGSIVSLTDCVASGNSSFGFLAFSIGSGIADMTLDHVQAALNGTGIQATTFSGPGSATIRFANSLVTQNGTGVNANSGIVLSSSPGTSVVAGNPGGDVSGSLGTPMTLR